MSQNKNRKWMDFPKLFFYNHLMVPFTTSVHTIDIKHNVFNVSRNSITTGLHFACCMILFERLFVQDVNHNILYHINSPYERNEPGGYIIDIKYSN